jgi:hypothetical protein
VVPHATPATTLLNSSRRVVRGSTQVCPVLGLQEGGQTAAVPSSEVAAQGWVERQPGQVVAPVAQTVPAGRRPLLLQLQPVGMVCWQQWRAPGQRLQMHLGWQLLPPLQLLVLMVLGQAVR